MRLTTADNCQNNYTLKRPFTKDGKLTGYAKIILFMDNQTEAWNRLELIDEVFDTNLALYRNSNRGTMVYIFATLNANDILTYSKSDKTWSKGRNFEQYIVAYLSEYRGENLC